MLMYLPQSTTTINKSKLSRIPHKLKSRTETWRNPKNSDSNARTSHYLAASTVSCYTRTTPNIKQSTAKLLIPILLLNENKSTGKLCVNKLSVRHSADASTLRPDTRCVALPPGRDPTGHHAMTSNTTMKKTSMKDHASLVLWYRRDKREKQENREREK